MSTSKKLCFWALLAICFVLPSCKEDAINVPQPDEVTQDISLPVVEMPENDYSLPEPFKHPNPHPEYNFLGFGYDVNQDFASLSGIREAVVDIEKGTLDLPSIINSSRPLAQELSHFGSENSATFLRHLAGWEKAGYAFANTLIGRFGSDALDENYIYGQSSIKVLFRRHRLLASVNTMKELLTDEFRSDVSSLDAEALVRRYGTHVMTAIYVGGKLDIFYQAKTLRKDRAVAAEMGVVRAFNSVFLSNEKQNVLPPNNQLQNYAERIMYRTLGGAEEVQFSGKVSLQNGFRTENSGKWQETLSEKNSVFVNIERPDSSLIPIYELIDDSDKSEEVRTYILDYIEKNMPLFSE